MATTKRKPKTMKGAKPVLTTNVILEATVSFNYRIGPYHLVSADHHPNLRYAIRRHVNDRADTERVFEYAGLVWPCGYTVVIHYTQLTALGLAFLRAVESDKTTIIPAPERINSSRTGHRFSVSRRYGDIVGRNLSANEERVFTDAVATRLGNTFTELSKAFDRRAEIIKSFPKLQTNARKELTALLAKSAKGTTKRKQPTAR